MTGRAGLAVLALLALAPCWGCEDVPMITFEGDASAGDAGPGNGDAGCPCLGLFCNQAACASCGPCKATDICCAKTANAICRPVCQ